MKLATIKVSNTRNHSEERNGRLIVVDTLASRAALVPAGLAPNLLYALEVWNEVENELRLIDSSLRKGEWKEPLELKKLSFRSPLPRCFAFFDGSAYLTHVKRVRKSRGAETPPDLYEVPLMYQGASDFFFGPEDPVPLIDESYGADFEAELAVVVDETPLGITEHAALKHIKLLMLLNDVSLRNLIPSELARGFGFLQGKPNSACAPFAITPDELGDAWHDGRAALQMLVHLNGKLQGSLDTKEMHFTFGKLISHAARTRPLSAGTIIGSGTVSNEDESRGIGCLVERRVIEIISTGAAKTPFLRTGDEVSIEAFLNKKSVFGSIKQRYI